MERNEQQLHTEDARDQKLQLALKALPTAGAQSSRPQPHITDWKAEGGRHMLDARFLIIVFRAGLWSLAFGLWPLVNEVEGHADPNLRQIQAGLHGPTC